jgi:hypothetical protein
MAVCAIAAWLMIVALILDADRRATALERRLELVEEQNDELTKCLRDAVFSIAMLNDRTAPK